MLTLDFKDISFMFILSPPVYKSFDVFRNGMNSLKRNFFLNSISKLRLAFLQILSFTDESGVGQYFMLERKKGRRMRRRVFGRSTSDLSNQMPSFNFTTDTIQQQKTTSNHAKICSKIPEIPPPKLCSTNTHQNKLDK